MNSTQIIVLGFIQAVQITCLALLVAAVLRLCGRKRPWLSHTLWMLVLLKCVTPPLWGHSLSPFSQAQRWLGLTEAATTSYAPPEETGPAPDRAPALPIRPVVAAPERSETSNRVLPALVGSEGLPAVVPEPPAATIPQGHSLSWQVWLLTVWLAGLATAGGSRLWRQHKWLRCLRREQISAVDDDTMELLSRLADRLKVRQTPSLLVTRTACSPAVTGLIQPVLILPEDLLRQLSPG